nr:DUF4422 domain-containing protein [Pectinatus haikarae]
MKIKILVVTHKPYWMPQDTIYLPICVGNRMRDMQITSDRSGDNIGDKNPDYCELTGMYWAWKNLKADYVGLAHYRRHFTVKKYVWSLEKRKKIVLTNEELMPILANTDIILPAKRKYYIETNKSHYNHAHQPVWLKETGNIIKKHYPDYEAAFKLVCDRRWAHMFNMFIMRKNYFDAYCEWLFSVLFMLENNVKNSGIKAEPRLYGFVSELLLDVWIEKNKIHYAEVGFIFMERQNWIKKIFEFLKRKAVPKFGRIK